MEAAAARRDCVGRNRFECGIGAQCNKHCLHGTDASGAVLPGVTVEVASPALIERVRTTATSDSGQYRVIDLRPGTYEVTFTLPGFNTVKREGVILTTDFTAQINIEMKVAISAETLTITDASPVVDVTNAQVQQQITRETLDLLPTGRSAWSLAKVLPGITSTGTDVGGSGGFQSLTVNVHGSKGDNVYQIYGMTVQSGIGNWTAPQYDNDGQFEEYTYTTSAIPAEVAYGGVRIQMTSRDGGNDFKGYGLGQYAKWQTDNYSDELQAACLRTPDQTIRIWDTQFSLGGPIMRDKLWFFFTQPLQRWRLPDRQQLLSRSSAMHGARAACTTARASTTIGSRAPSGG